MNRLQKFKLNFGQSELVNRNDGCWMWYIVLASKLVDKICKYTMVYDRLWTFGYNSSNQLFILCYHINNDWKTIQNTQPNDRWGLINVVIKMICPNLTKCSGVLNSLSVSMHMECLFNIIKMDHKQAIYLWFCLLSPIIKANLYIDWIDILPLSQVHTWNSCLDKSVEAEATQIFTF